MTKRKIISAALAVLLAASSVLSLASCNKTTEAKKEKRTNVYAGTDINLPEGIDYINSVSASGNAAYIRYTTAYSVTYNELGEEVEREPGYNYDEVAEREKTLPDGWYIGYGNQNMIGTVDLSTGSMTGVPLEYDQEQYGWVNSQFAVAPDGSLIAVSTASHYGDDYMSFTQENYLLKINPATGELTEAISLDEMLQSAGINSQEAYINSYAIIGDTFYIALDDSVLAFGIDGSSRGKINLGINAAEFWMNNLIACGDRLVVSYYTGSSSSKMKVIENGVASDLDSESLATSRNMQLMAGDAENLYFSSSTGIYAYNFAQKTFGEVLNFINSDVDASFVDNAVFLEDGRLVMASTDWTSGKTVSTITVMKRVPDEELQEEVILKLGCAYVDFSLRRAIIRYNKQNTGIRVTLVDYSVYNNEENDYKGASNQLNNDIAMGKMPDIVQINNDMPIENYFRKNIFADLNQYIDDPEIGIERSKLMTNVLDANSTNGKLPSMIISYTVNTLLAKSELVGTEPGWTFEEMMAAINALPEGAKAFYDYSRDNIISNFFQYAMESFIDWDNQTTHFDSPGFVEFAKYLATCPEKNYWEEVYGDDYEYDPTRDRQIEEDYQLRFVKDMAMFNMSYFYNYTDFLTARAQFMADVTAIGYPTTGDDNGAVIVPNLELAVSVKSTAQKEAWEFIKYLIKNFADVSIGNSFSISREYMDELYAKSRDNFSEAKYGEADYDWMKESGYSEDYINYRKNSSPKYDQEAVDYIRDIVNNASRIARTDSSLVDIVKEELSALFAGQKSAEEVSKQIASRAGIYVAEHS